MTTENVNLSVDNPDNIKSTKLRKQAARGSVCLALTLAICKLVAFVMSGSIAILTSLADSAIDLISSSITLFSVSNASLPPDTKHRYGHGKIESLAAFSQSIFICVSAAYLIKESVQRFINPIELAKFDWALGVMCISILLTGSLVVFQRIIIKKTNSLAIKADNANYTGDLSMNLAVIISLLFTKYTGIVKIDAAFGLIVACLLFKTAYEIFSEALAVLMDKELSEEDRAKIIELVKSHKDVFDVHDLRTRHTGYVTFIEFHMEVAGKKELFKVHDITESIEKKLYEAFPDADITIHPEPHGIDDFKRDDLVKEEE